MLGVGAAIFTILSYLKGDSEQRPGLIEPVGKLFFFYASAICWAIFALGSLSLLVRFGQSEDLIDFTYMPVNGEEYLALIPGAFSFIQFVSGFAHSIEYFAARPIKEAADRLERGRFG